MGWDAGWGERVEDKWGEWVGCSGSDQLVAPPGGGPSRNGLCNPDRRIVAPCLGLVGRGRVLGEGEGGQFNDIARSGTCVGKCQWRAVA